MPQLQFSEEEYQRLMERVYKVLDRTEELDHVTHHLMWEVWRLLHHGKVTEPLPIQQS
ncbi:hypothetical protein [Brevibacillus fulvus]|uniref:Uncharacterized protein n=1 Tax=Brevibacillus fulvus TaxID=1125967 RepID=A0A939BNF9_9BACL|nr:hypothetical protein [Brevibacillus fulvus]MBM7588990.1 hypothetical protein [Brevibacillus fulvus]